MSEQDKEFEGLLKSAGVKVVEVKPDDPKPETLELQIENLWKKSNFRERMNYPSVHLVAVITAFATRAANDYAAFLAPKIRAEERKSILQKLKSFKRDPEIHGSCPSCQNQESGWLCGAGDMIAIVEEQLSGEGKDGRKN